MGICDRKNNYFIANTVICDVIDLLNTKEVYTFDQKKNLVLLKKEGLELNCNYDAMIAVYLLNINTKDDIAYLMNNNGCEVKF